MLLSAGLLALLLLMVLVVIQMCSALGGQRGVSLGVMMVLSLGGTWGGLELVRRQERPPPEDQTSSRPVSSQSCARCHEAHYTSWHRTYHRTMTREATPENVKADFDDAV